MATPKKKRSGKKPHKKRSGSAKSRQKSGGIIHDRLPKNAVTLVVILKPREGQELMLEAELHALLTPSRKEEGCLRFDLYRITEGPVAFLLHEVWETRERHTAHTKTDHFLRWNARKDSVVASREAAFWKHIA